MYDNSENINAQIIVNSDNKENISYGKIILTPSSNFDAQVTVSNKNDLNAKVSVSVKNKMFGSIQVEEKPARTIKINTIQDSFVRSKYPTLNYGEQKDLIIGSNTEENFRTFLNFNFDNLPSNIIFISAKLKLMSTDNQIANSLIELYEASAPWYEYGITYNSQPSLGNKIGTYSDIENSVLINNVYYNIEEFDLMDVISDWVKGIRCKNGLVIKTQDESNNILKRYFSKESGYAPYLELVYYDLSPVSYGYSRLPSKVSVSNTLNNSISATVTVPKYENGNDLLATVKSRNGSLINAYVGVTRDTINSKVTIPEYSYLPSQVKVSNNQLNEINGIVGITHDGIKATVKVTSYKDLNSTIAVRRTDNNYIPSQVIVSKPFISGLIKVWEKSHLLANVIVKRNDANDINGLVIAKRNENSDLKSKLIVTYFNDLSAKVNIIGQGNNYQNANIVVRQNINKDFNAKLIVTYFNDLLARVKVNGYTDLPSKIIVRNNIEGDFLAKVSVSCSEDLNCCVKVSNALLSGSVSVQNFAENDINAQIKVSPISDLKSTVIVMKYNSILAKVNVMIPFATDFNAIVKTKDPSVINGMVTIRESLNSDINSNIAVTHSWLNGSVTVSNPFIFAKTTVSQPNLNATVLVNLPFIKATVSVSRPDINSSVNVNKGFLNSTVSVFKSFIDSKVLVNRPFIDGKVNIREIANSDLNAIIRATNFTNENNDLTATVNIRPINKMYGKIEIDTPPIINYTNNAVQDTFIRKNVPTLNYGHSNDMYVGEDYNSDIFRSLLKFNVSDFPSSAYILSAKIVLTSFTIDYFSSDLELYEATSTWNEYGVTYNSQPTLGKLLSTVTTDETGEITTQFDITSIINDYLQGKVAKSGFIIKSKDETNGLQKRFYTREGLYPPQIQIEYFDTKVLSLGSSLLNANVVVQNNDKKDLNATITIPRYDYNSDLNCKVNVRNTTYIWAKVNVSKGDIYSKIIVRNNKESDISSIIYVRNYDENQILGQVVINQPDLQSNVIIRRYDENDLNANVIVNRNENCDINATVSVRLYNNSNLLSKVSVSNPYINSIVNVSLSGDLISTVTVSNNIIVDLKSKVLVMYTKDLNSEINVTQVSDLKAKVSIQNGGFNDLYSKIVIPSMKDLSSILNVTQINDLSATITVQNNKISDISSKINVTNVSNINSIVNVTNKKDLSAKICVPADNNLNAIITIMQINDILATVKINSGNIEAKVVVRNNKESDINANIIVLPASNLKARVKITKFKDINAKIIVRQPDVNDMSAIVIIHNKNAIGYVFIM
jgi:hypothetical protein